MKWIAVAALVFPLSAMAQERSMSDAEMRGFNNYHNELMTCANYFMLVQRCVSNTPGAKPEVVAGYSKAADELIGRSFVIGKMIGMTQDAQMSRMKMEGEAMMALVNNDCVNISSAMTRYLDRCELTFNDTEKVLSEHLAKASR